MKVINLNESQYRRLFEVSQGVISLGQETPSNIPEFKDQEEIGDDAKLTGKDEIVKNQDPQKTDDKQEKMSADGPWQRPGRIGGV